jgi:antitoxin (DNA-binding transcriptional repressor) of toxin-antitoxin stability system
MKVTMVEINKEASSIVNRVAETGETATIYKHGKPFAEIRPLTDLHANMREIAYRKLLRFQSAKVDEPIIEVIAKGRRRGV